MIILLLILLFIISLSFDKGSIQSTAFTKNPVLKVSNSIVSSKVDSLEFEKKMLIINIQDCLDSIEYQQKKLKNDEK